MRQSLIAAGTLFLWIAWAGLAQETKTGDRAAQARPEKPIVVPQGKTNVRLDAKKKKVIARYTAGQTMSAVVDCFIIACPAGFPKDDVCWECQDRPAKPKTDAVLQR